MIETAGLVARWMILMQVVVECFTILKKKKEREKEKEGGEAPVRVSHTTTLAVASSELMT